MLLNCGFYIDVSSFFSLFLDSKEEKVFDTRKSNKMLSAPSLKHHQQMFLKDSGFFQEAVNLFLNEKMVETVSQAERLMQMEDRAFRQDEMNYLHQLLDGESHMTGPIQPVAFENRLPDRLAIIICFILMSLSRSNRFYSSP